ncbi:MAG: outer membrane lipoprotein-sorting protein [Myxococcales bacterium]|nr:outer membrane lipoprotein-sorting protein [Myxococcales bacterium]
MRPDIVWVGALAMALAAGGSLAGESAAEISQKARDRGALNLLDLTAELKLITVAKDGKAKEQVVSSSSRKIGGRAHSLSRFLQPAGVAGVAVLTVEGSGGEGDEISLYLPKLRRVRKVAKNERGKAFMDTDFSYADLAGTGTKDSELERLADQKLDGRDAYVISGPGGADSPYGKVTVFVDRETYVPLKVEYQDKEGKPFKAYRTVKLKRFKDRTLAVESTMENLQSGSKTTMQILRLEESKLGEEAFSERALERG